MRCVILICGWAVLNCGCSVTGFQNLPDGPTNPSQLRAAAAIARAEAQALDEVADQQEGVIRQVVGAVQQAADTIGAPAIVTGLIGAGAGLAVPTPGQRRREKVAKAEGAAEKTSA